MDLEDFTKQFAIRLPDGTLYGLPAYSMAGVLQSLGIAPAYSEDQPLETVVYDSLEEAQAALESMKRAASRMGITSWLGRIETRYCTQFSNTDPAEDVVASFTEMLKGEDDDA